MGTTDTASIAAIEPNGSILLHIDTSAMIVPHRPKVSLILVIPRPLRLKKLLPVISNLGVHKLALIGAPDGENKEYFGIHMFIHTCISLFRVLCFSLSLLIIGLQQLHHPKLMRKELIEGLAQANHDCFLPDVVVRRQFSSFLCRDLDEMFPCSQYERVVAHPSSVEEDVLFARPPQRLSEYRVREENPVAVPPSEPAAALAPKELVIAVGSEGGWHRKDLDLLESMQFSAVHLGPRVLRSDTAVRLNHYSNI